jgi:hypothetical protein
LLSTAEIAAITDEAAMSGIQEPAMRVIEEVEANCSHLDAGGSHQEAASSQQEAATFPEMVRA